MNWTPIVAAALGPLVIYTISKLSSGPEVALRQRLLDDIKIQDALSPGTPAAVAYEQKIALDAARLHNLRDVIDAQRSSTLAIWLLGTASFLFFLAGHGSAPGVDRWPMYAASGVYVVGMGVMVMAKSRIKRFKDKIEKLSSRPQWIWRNALALPPMSDEKMDLAISSADELIAERIMISSKIVDK